MASGYRLVLKKPFASATYVGKYYLDGIETWSLKEGDDLRAVLVGDLRDITHVYMEVTNTPYGGGIENGIPSNDLSLGNALVKVNISNLTGDLQTPCWVILNDQKTERTERVMISVYKDNKKEIPLSSAY
jgi:hypothetical protein